MSSTSSEQPDAGRSGASIDSAHSASPPADRASRSDDNLLKGVRDRASGFDFTLLVGGHKADDSPPSAAPHRPDEALVAAAAARTQRDSAVPPATADRGGNPVTARPPRPGRAAPIVFAVIAVVAAAALLVKSLEKQEAGGSGNVAASGGATAVSPNAATAGLHLRLPTAGVAPSTGAHSPVFILSDFELAPGGWQPDRRLPACQNASASRVRDRAAQGAYWLKVDRVHLDPEIAEAAAVVRPDTKDLTSRGTTVSIAFFVPKSAPRGLRGGIVIDDSQGVRHRQPNPVPLSPGEWTTVSWEAGDLLADTAELGAAVTTQDVAYDGYFGIDNVLLRSDVPVPVGSVPIVAAARDGSVHVGQEPTYLARIGMGFAGSNWEPGTPSGTVQVTPGQGAVTCDGQIAAPGPAGGAVSYRLSARPEYNRALVVSVDVTFKARVLARAVGIDVAIPKSVFGGASLDVAPGGRVASRDAGSSPQLAAASTSDLHVAGDAPYGFELRSEAPATVLVLDNTVPTTFTLVPPKPVQSVNIAGAFNGWNTTATPMQRLADGRTWQVTVQMAPGEQQYKYILEGGQWITDPQSPRDVKDAQGNLNSVRIVPKPAGDTGPPMFHVIVSLAGQPDGAPATIDPGKTLHGSVRIGFNQPFRNDLARVLQ